MIPRCLPENQCRVHGRFSVSSPSPYNRPLRRQMNHIFMAGLPFRPAAPADSIHHCPCLSQNIGRSKPKSAGSACNNSVLPANSSFPTPPSGGETQFRSISSQSSSPRFRLVRNCNYPFLINGKKSFIKRQEILIPAQNTQNICN